MKSTSRRTFLGQTTAACTGLALYGNTSVLAKRFDEPYLDSKDPQDHNDSNLQLF